MIDLGAIAMKKTCYPLDNNHLRFTGFLSRPLGICCETIQEAEIPCVNLEFKAEDSFKSWENLMAQVRAEADIELCDRTVSKACYYCPNKRLFLQNIQNEKIKLVNISMYPAPCQSDCIYCGMRASGAFNMSDKENVNETYRRVIELCNYLKENDKLDNDVEFQISSGEIAIHPFKKEILDVIGNATTQFFSNGMKFDEGVATKLKQNPKSSIQVSLDCGTSRTWKVVKKRDNFQKTLDNLIRYRESTTRKEQIELKYIVLPGINAADEDFDGIIKIMKKLDVQKLIISKDSWGANDKKAMLIGDLKKLVAKLVENDLAWSDDYNLSLEELNILKVFEDDFRRGIKFNNN